LNDHQHMENVTGPVLDIRNFPCFGNVPICTGLNANG